MFQRGWWGNAVAETLARIRRERFVKGETIKEIARDLRGVFERGSLGVLVGRDVVSARADRRQTAAVARSMGS